MGIGIGTALLLSSAIGIGASAIQANKQKKLASERSRKEDELAIKARQDEKLIRDASATPETATFEFGGGNKEDTSGTFDDFITPKTNSSLNAGLGGAGSGTGLGFNI